MDLKALCLVSKEMHELAVRGLYREISLHVGSDKDEKIVSMLSPRNKGLKHIRKLKMGLEFVPYNDNRKQQAQSTVQKLLEYLPEDILDEFSWTPWYRFDAENMKCLHRKQKRMRTLEAIPLDETIPSAELFPEASIEKACKITIYVEGRETLDRAAYAIRHTADRIEDLIIDADSEFAYEQYNLHDTALRPGLLTSTIFSSRMPFKTAAPFRNLNALQLRDIGLHGCHETYCKVVDFSRLRALRLYSCPGAFTPLSQLCDSHNLPTNLETFDFQHTTDLEDEPSDELDDFPHTTKPEDKPFDALDDFQHTTNPQDKPFDALDDFLSLVSGIKYLTLDLESLVGLPAAKGITRHAKTLKLLNLHAWMVDDELDVQNVEEHLLHIEGFEEIVTACTQLEQLSLAWPLKYIGSAPSELWKAYEAQIHKLRNLVTLNITTWPMDRPGSHQFFHTDYKTILRYYAQRLFANAVTPQSSPDAATVTTPLSTLPNSNDDNVQRPAKLRIVAFGKSNRTGLVESKYQAIFLRSSTTNALGEQEPAAVPISCMLLQHVESRSYVLDFPLKLGGENPMPCSWYTDRDH